MLWLQQRQRALHDVRQSGEVAVTGGQRQGRADGVEGGAGAGSDAEPGRRSTALPLQQIGRRHRQ